MQHGVQPVRQIRPRRHLIRDARVADLPLGAHDTLGHCRRSSEEGACDLLGREATYLAQRERQLSVLRQRGTTAGEDQPQPVVLASFLFPPRAVTGVGVESFGKLRQRRVEAGAPAHAVDGLEASGRDEPRPGIGGHAIPRPPLQGRREGRASSARSKSPNRRIRVARTRRESER